jgi:hypothetical protein
MSRFWRGIRFITFSLTIKDLYKIYIMHDLESTPKNTFGPAVTLAVICIYRNNFTLIFCYFLLDKL